MTFDWLIPFADSFVNSDWLELVIYFHTNEQDDDEQNAFTANFSDNSDLRPGFTASLCDFWERDISRRTVESHRCVFRR